MSERVLVVDDNRMNRMKLAHDLQQEGHVVDLAENGMQALEMMRSQSFDVVLLDILMPEMDGHEVLAEMKRDPGLRDLPVIVISAVDEMDSVVRCIEMGAEDYLPKPFNATLLRARLNASLQKKQLRDLERAYLQQEMALRQNEKLATLGKLSAGVAHELNNPAAAVRRGAQQLSETIARLQHAQIALGELQPTAAKRASLEALDQRARSHAAGGARLSAVERSDREAALEQWLRLHGLEDGWAWAPSLVQMGYDPEALGDLASGLADAQLAALLTWVDATFASYELLEEIHRGAAHISEIVTALKSSSYMDQAPAQDVDVHEGIENTLVMLRSKLREGVTVHRDYSEDLPRIPAYGSELNQVWTNLIDNAVDAMAGHGEIAIRTRRQGDWVVVEIEDNGPGIPAALQPRIFDPFFTTKAPGQGTGLGLNISHNIIVQRHKGKLTVSSVPGRTCFEAWLPITADLA